MENSLASPNLAIVSYRMATISNYLTELVRQIKAGKVEGGQEFTMEEAAALSVLLEEDSLLGQKENISTDEPLGGLGTWIG